jgi:hypothetical protein
VMDMDQDRELIYQRKITEVEAPAIMKDYPASPASEYRYYSTWSFQVYARVLGFCGKVYPVLQLATNRTKAEDKVFAYSVDDVDNFVLANYKEREIEAYLSKAWDNHWPQTDRHNKFATFFEEAKKVESNYVHVFQEYKTPIWVYDFFRKSNKRLILNAPLKQLEFFRIMDAYTAYQELLMFYGGMAQPFKPIPQMSDEIKAEASGHGGKYSFRKPPSK